MKNNNQKYKFHQSKKTIKGNTLIVPEKKNSSFLPIIIAFCLPVLLYLQTINFGFIYFDDNRLIINNIPFLSHFENVRHIFFTDAYIIKSSPYYRPLQTLSFMLDIQLSGRNNVWMYHLSNILLLGLIACSLFLLLKRFLIPPKLALLGTLIYCVHPLFVFTIAYIPTRGELLLTFFSLLSFLFFIDFLQKRKIIYLFLNWATFTIALFCKETAAILPFIFIIYYFTFPTGKRFEKKYFFLIMLYAVSGFFWFWLRSKAVGNFSNPEGTFGLVAILLNLRTIPESLSKFFLLINIAPIPGFSILKTLAGLGLIVIIIIIFFKNKERQKKEFLFCFLWFLILMFPPMLYKHPLIDYLDHRFFLPLIGILLFLLFIFPKKWLGKGDIKRAWLIVVIIVFLSSFTFIKSRSYSNPMTFFNSVISQNPNSVLAYYNRGTIKRERNDIQGAIEDYNRAIAICPNYADAHNNRGLIKFNMGDKPGAIEDYNRAIAINPNYADAYYNRGVAKANIGDNLGAIKDYSNAIAIRPNYEKAYNNKGVSMYLSGNFQEAIINLNKAIEINPNYLEAYVNRAITKYSLKDFTGVIEDCEKMLKLNPNDEKALNLKANAQQELQKGSH